MTVEEMHKRFLVSFDSMDTAMAPELTPEAIDVLLNEAQEDLINEVSELGIERTQTLTDYISRLVTTYSTNVFQNGTKDNGKVVNLPADYRKMLSERLEVLVPGNDIQKEIKNGKEYIVISGSIVYNGVTYNSGDRFTGVNTSTYSGKGLVKELVKKTIIVKPETRDRYMMVINNPFKSPDENIAIRLFNSGDSVELILGKNVFPVSYMIDYIRHPQKIVFGSAYAIPQLDQDCELSEEAQKRIIDKALVKACKILKQEAYEVYKLEEFTNRTNN